MGRDLLIAAAIISLLYANDRRAGRAGLRNSWRGHRGNSPDERGCCCHGRRHMCQAAGRR